MATATCSNRTEYLPEDAHLAYEPFAWIGWGAPDTVTIGLIIGIGLLRREPSVREENGPIAAESEERRVKADTKLATVGKCSRCMAQLILGGKTLQRGLSISRELRISAVYRFGAIYRIGVVVLSKKRIDPDVI